jgi:hypothetical protein
VRLNTGDKKRVLVGYFAREEDAARAYDAAALAHLGPHALVNFPVQA